jgi:SAM-dependent methyltransferase
MKLVAHTQESQQWRRHVRAIEYQTVVDLLGHNASGSVLEIGAGSGEELEVLREYFDRAVGVEVTGSSYRPNNDGDTGVANLTGMDEVILYDGKHLPFQEEAFDVILSFHVMEHVEDVTALLSDISRVLKPGGYSVHVVPSPTWRWLSTLFYYPAMLKRLVEGKISRDSGQSAYFRKESIWSKLLPRKHGVKGNLVTEPFHFGAKRWRGDFSDSGTDLLKIVPVRYTYFGSDLFRFSLSDKRRECLSRILGSSSNVYFSLKPIVSKEQVSGAKSEG